MDGMWRRVVFGSPCKAGVKQKEDEDVSGSEDMASTLGLGSGAASSPASSNGSGSSSGNSRHNGIKYVKNAPDLLAPLRALDFSRLHTSYVTALLLIQGGVTFEVLRILYPDYVFENAANQAGGGPGRGFPNLALHAATMSGWDVVSNPLRPKRDPERLRKSLADAIGIWSGGGGRWKSVAGGSPTSLTAPHLHPKPFDLTTDHFLSLRWTVSIDHPETLFALLPHLPPTVNLTKILQDLLLTACISGAVLTASHLLKHSDPTFMDHLALRIACEKGHLGIVEMVLGCTEVDLGVLEDMPLRAAAANGHLEIVRFILAKGVDPSALEWDAATGAARAGHAGVVDLLLGAAEERHTGGGSLANVGMLGLALKLAAREGFDGIVERILKFWDREDCGCCDGRCGVSRESLDMALGMAAERGHERIVVMLLTPPELSCGVLNGDQCCSGKSPGALSSPRHGNIVVNPRPHPHRSSPTAGSNYALHHASLFGHLNVIKALLSIPDPPDPSTKSNFAFRKAASRGHTDVCMYLLTFPGVEAGCNGFEALWTSARNGHVGTVAKLLEWFGCACGGDRGPVPTEEVVIDAACMAAEQGHHEVFAVLMGWVAENGRGAGVAERTAISRMPGSPHAVNPAKASAPFGARTVQDRVVAAIATAVHRGFAEVLREAVCLDAKFVPQISGGNPQMDNGIDCSAVEKVSLFNWTSAAILTWTASAALSGSLDAIESGIPACISMLLKLKDSDGVPILDGETVSSTLLPACVLRGFDDLVEEMLVGRLDVRKWCREIVASGSSIGASMGISSHFACSPDSAGVITSPTSRQPVDPFAIPSPSSLYVSNSTPASSLLILACTDPILQLPQPSRTFAQRPRRARIVRMLLDVYEEDGGRVDEEMIWKAAVKAAQNGFMEAVEILLKDIFDLKKDGYLDLVKTREDIELARDIRVSYLTKALLTAVTSNHPKIVPILLRQINLPVKDLHGALLQASQAGQRDTVVEILEHLSKRGEFGRGKEGRCARAMAENALMLAIEGGHLETALVLDEGMKALKGRKSGNGQR
ncbi:hypothetical protein HDU97_009419 [Phlyctochytrium planicorne]|nr:hypothetical protein HDU97_009419 [Phlyctochytrium planicorne]